MLIVSCIYNLMTYGDIVVNIESDVFPPCVHNLSLRRAHYNSLIRSSICPDCKMIYTTNDERTSENTCPHVYYTFSNL